MTIRTCVPADPQSKGRSEATVRIATADLVPTSASCWRSAARSPSWRRHAGSSASRSTRARTGRPAGRRSPTNAPASTDRARSPGSPSIRAEHYPPPTAAAKADGERVPRAGSAAEAEFLALGPGATSWLVEAAAAGARGVRRKIAEAVALAKLHPPGEVDRALATAAVAGRFAENDVLRILAHQAGRDINQPTVRASETHGLQPGTSAWSGFGLDPAGLDVCGPSGTGKSHFCEALGEAAVEAGMTVAWFTIEDLSALVRRHPRRRLDHPRPRETDPAPA